MSSRCRLGAQTYGRELPSVRCDDRWTPSPPLVWPMEPRSSARIRDNPRNEPSGSTCSAIPGGQSHFVYFRRLPSTRH